MAARPPIARKHTPASEKKRNSMLDTGIQITYLGKVYSVRAGDLTAVDAQALRKELGVSFMGLIRALHDDPDIDLVAGVMWLSRRVKGDHIPYEMVAAELGYEALETMVLDNVTDAEEVGENPEG